MRPLWLHAIRSWSASPGRALAAVLSVALGVGTVVTITSFYETARITVHTQVVGRWLGAAHLTVHPPGAHWGSLDASFAEKLNSLDNVAHVTARLTRPMKVAGKWVDAIGIDPVSEAPFLNLPQASGRMIREGERNVAVMEQEAAAAIGAGIGETFELYRYDDGPRLSLTLVGTFESRRVAQFQRPVVYLPISDLQALTDQPGRANAIDVMLQEPSAEALAATEDQIRALIAETDAPHNYRIQSAAARLRLLDEAEGITRLLLLLIACVALLTSFFIILTTMSMSLFVRRQQLGLLRCLGVTRAQMAGLLFCELSPLGLVGTMAGVLLGIGVTRLVAGEVSHVIPRIVLSPWGVGLAVGSGLLTTLLCTAFLLFQICRVAPLAAVSTQARPPRLRYLYYSGLVGLALLAFHEWMVRGPDPSRWLKPTVSMLGMASIYLGYILVAPALVVLLGTPIARLVGPLLGLNRRLAVDQFGRAPWRSTGACWVLMVGLSLIVYLGIGGEAVKAVWDFPGRLPEVFVWSPEYVPAETIDRVRRLPGVSEATVTTDVDCELTVQSSDAGQPSSSFVAKFLRSLTRPVFVAGDRHRLLKMLKVTFIEGDEAEALRKLDRGGYVLIPVQTAQFKHLSVGDRITVAIEGRRAQFEIAGVVQSPALDIAVTAFQATSYMQFAAASAVLGTRADLKDKFGIDAVSMFMCNLDLPARDPPPSFTRESLADCKRQRYAAGMMLEWRDRLPLESDTYRRFAAPLKAWLSTDENTPLPADCAKHVTRFQRAAEYVEWHGRNRPRAEQWAMFRERLAVLRIAYAMDRPGAVMGSLVRLKQAVDASIRNSIVVITWLPSIVLIVAAIGIGNLMMVSVHIRARQIATLRAVGALKSQIVRLILAEAIALGLIGSVIGLALGFHEAYSDNRLTARLIGFHPEFIVPVGTVALGVALNVVTCLVAGILPARHAARNNIIDAMQSA